MGTSGTYTFGLVVFHVILGSIDALGIIIFEMAIFKTPLQSTATILFQQNLYTYVKVHTKLSPGVLIFKIYRLLKTLKI